MLENYVDRAKELLLYRYQSGDNNVSQMLSMDELANSRLNLEMAKFEIALHRIDSNWKGNWNCLLSKDFGQQLERAFLTLDGYARCQAIEMEGQRTIAEKEILKGKDRGGLLSLFQGNKDQ